MEELYGNHHIDTTSDQHQYMAHVNEVEKEEEVDIGTNGDDHHRHQQQQRVISTSHHHSKHHQYQTIVDTNDMKMMIHTSSLHYNTATTPIHHRYVLTDDEVELSLQELDDTIASLDGTNKQRRHHRTHTAGSTTPGSHGVVSSSTTVVDESSSISSSVHTERTQAVLIHRQLIDNMETLSYHHRNHNHHTSRHRSNNSINRNKKRSNGGGTGGKSISSRVSTNSRRSKLSNAQQSYSTYRSHTGGGSTTSRPPRGPSLERVIFQTLLHAARSDIADVHFIRRPDEDDDNDDDNNDKSVNTNNNDNNNNNDDDNDCDITTESILKDLIQADTILSVEVGSQSTTIRNNDDCNNVIDCSGNTVHSITNEINNNPCLLLPPIATEEEPELLSTSTAHQQKSQQMMKDQSIPTQAMGDDEEWEPDFDAITFPTTCGGNTTTYLESSTMTDPISSALVHVPPKSISSKNTTIATTTMTTSRMPSTTSIKSLQQNPQYLSKDDSPESDIFDQIGDSYDETLSFFDDKNTVHDEAQENNINNNNNPVQNEEKSLLRPVLGPTVKVFVNTNNTSNDNNNNMQPYYDEDNDTSVVGSTSSWGVFDTTAVQRPITDYNENDDDNYNNPCYDPFFTSVPTNTTTTVVAIEKRHSPRSDVLTIPTNPTSDESIFFPTVLQDKPSTATTTTSSPPIHDNYDHLVQQQQQHDDNDQWMIFDKNPFASRNTDPSLSLSSPFLQKTQQRTEIPNFFADHTMNNHNHNNLNHNNHSNDMGSNNSTSQDNVSASSPASVVQFVQIVDRCPSNKSSSDTNNNNLPFDTKCSF
jgi:hypothetical protein